jgi:hypothetical protein
MILCVALAAGCGTVDLGDNIVPPDLMLDEGFFYCQIVPGCLERHSCAGGLAGEEGQCHTSRSSLRLIDTVAERVAAPACDGDELLGAPPPEYVQNLTAVRFTVQTDPLSSPFYRRPLGMDSHPRTIFGPDDACAALIRDWIARGAR